VIGRFLMIVPIMGGGSLAGKQDLAAQRGHFR